MHNKTAQIELTACFIGIPSFFMGLGLFGLLGGPLWLGRGFQLLHALFEGANLLRLRADLLFL
jgi:hypothetical protein